jgi:hypothetical protein
MNGLTRWNPFREMQELHHRLNTLLDAGFGRRTDGGEKVAIERAGSIPSDPSPGRRPGDSRGRN